MQLGTMTAINIVHSVGAMLAFGLSCVYVWMHVALSFATRPELSTIAVCWIRVVAAFIASVMFIFCILFRAVLIVMLAASIPENVMFRSVVCPSVHVSRVFSNINRALGVVLATIVQSRQRRLSSEIS